MQKEKIKKLQRYQISTMTFFFFFWAAKITSTTAFTVEIQADITFFKFFTLKIPPGPPLPKKERKHE